MWALNHAFLHAHNKPMWGKLLHTAHRSFYTDLFTHRRNCNFTSVFGDRTSFRAKGLRRKTWKSQFDLSFWRSNLISCERVATGTRKSQFYCTSVFDDRTSFRAKGLRGTHELAILSQFWAIQPHFVRKGCAGRRGNRNLTSVFGDRTSFRAKGMRREPGNRNFTVPSQSKGRV